MKHVVYVNSSCENESCNRKRGWKTIHERDVVYRIECQKFVHERFVGKHVHEHFQRRLNEAHIHAEGTFEIILFIPHKTPKYSRV